jgi:hypothetical protein
MEAAIYMDESQGELLLGDLTRFGDSQWSYLILAWAGKAQLKLKNHAHREAPDS